MIISVDRMSFNSVHMLPCEDGYLHCFPEFSDGVGPAALCGSDPVTVEAEEDDSYEFVCESCAELLIRWASDGTEGLGEAGKA